jgi:NAD+ synthase (glutamine-hydrolysing)
VSLCFQKENLRYLERVAEHSSGITVVVGFVDVKADIYNAAAVIHNRKVAGVNHKLLT